MIKRIKAIIDLSAFFQIFQHSTLFFGIIEKHRKIRDAVLTDL